MRVAVTVSVAVGVTVRVVMVVGAAAMLVRRVDICHAITHDRHAHLSVSDVQIFHAETQRRNI